MNANIFGLEIICASDLGVESAGLWAPPGRRDGWSHKCSDPAAPTVPNQQKPASLKEIIPELNRNYVLLYLRSTFALSDSMNSLPGHFFDCVPARCRWTCWRSLSGRSCLLPQSTPWWIQPGSEGRNCPSDRPRHAPLCLSHLLQELKTKVSELVLITKTLISCSSTGLQLWPWIRSHQSGGAFASAGNWGRLSWWPICPDGWTPAGGAAECGPAHKTPPSPDSAGIWLHHGTAASSAPSCSYRKRRRRRRRNMNGHVINSVNNTFPTRQSLGSTQLKHRSQADVPPGLLSTCFQAFTVGSEMSQTKENRMWFTSAAGSLPRSSLPLLSSLFNISSAWPALIRKKKNVLTRQKQQPILRFTRK